MNSLILRTSAGYVLTLAILLSLFVLWRGHNAPGGGFIGGLIASSGIIVYALAFGRDAAQRLLRVDPKAIGGVGVATAVLSGLGGIIAGHAFLTHLWTFPGGIGISTALMFDIGVFLAVVGTVVAFLFDLLDA